MAPASAGAAAVPDDAQDDAQDSEEDEVRVDDSEEDDEASMALASTGKRPRGGVETSCDWVGPISLFKEHLIESCECEPVQCEDCTQLVPRGAMEEHLETTCPYRQVRCAHCDVKFQHQLLRAHETVCDDAFITCPNTGCYEFVKRCLMASHISECDHQIIACPCPGCELSFERLYMQDHIDNSTREHLQDAWRQMGKMQKNIEMLEKKVGGYYHMFDLYSMDAREEPVTAYSDEFVFPPGCGAGRGYVTALSFNTFKVGFEMLKRDGSIKLELYTIGKDGSYVTTSSTGDVYKEISNGAKRYWDVVLSPTQQDRAVRPDGTVRFRVYVQLQASM